jgi:hypothetical protein
MSILGTDDEIVSYLPLDRWFFGQNKKETKERRSSRKTFKGIPSARINSIHLIINE